MLFAILLLNLVLLCLTDAGADAKSSPKLGLENLVEKLEFRLEEMETEMKNQANEKEKLAAKNKEMETRMEKLENRPIVLISAWRETSIASDQTVTFESFLANHGNGGEHGVFDLDSGVFTCFTPGFYTVSFSAYGLAGADYGPQQLFLYKNGLKLPESGCSFFAGSAFHHQGQNIAMTGSRILVSYLLEMFA